VVVSVVRFIFSASPSSELLNPNHSGIISLLVSFESGGRYEGADGVAAGALAISPGISIETGSRRIALRRFENSHLDTPEACPGSNFLPLE
jgi:hypothetical protein